MRGMARLEAPRQSAMASCVLFGGASASGFESGNLVDELDQGHLGGIALPSTQLEDAGVPTRTILVAGTNLVEELPDHSPVTDLGSRQAARMQIATLCERDQTLR